MSGKTLLSRTLIGLNTRSKSLKPEQRDGFLVGRREPTFASVSVQAPYQVRVTLRVFSNQ